MDFCEIWYQYNQFSIWQMVLRAILFYPECCDIPLFILRSGLLKITFGNHTCMAYRSRCKHYVIENTIIRLFW